MADLLEQLIELLESIQHRLENKPDKTPTETLLLVDAGVRLDVARSLKEKRNG